MANEESVKCNNIETVFKNNGKKSVEKKLLYSSFSKVQCVGQKPMQWFQCYIVEYW